MNLIERIADTASNVYLTFHQPEEDQDFGTVSIETDDPLCSKFAISINEEFVFGLGDIEDGVKYHIDHVNMGIVKHAFEDFDEYIEAWNLRIHRAWCNL